MFQGFTKPADMAKHQKSKRQNLALFMDTLMGDQPKVEDKSSVDLQDPAYNYYVSIL